MSPQIMPSDPELRSNRAEEPPRSRRMRGCATTSGCSGAFSAIPCATRKAPTCSTWSSVSGRPRSGSTAMKTGRRGTSWNNPRQHVDQPDRAHRARLQLFLASRQHRRRPEQHPADARPRHGGAGAGNAGCDPGACARSRHQRRRSAEIFRQRPGQPGPDRASDRSAPQEHHRPRDGDRRAAGPARAGAVDAGRNRGRATSSCAARC